MFSKLTFDNHIQISMISIYYYKQHKYLKFYTLNTSVFNYNGVTNSCGNSN